MSLDKCVTSIEAGEMLDLAPCTIRRYAQRGLIDSKWRGKTKYFLFSQIIKLRRMQSARHNLGDKVKELFVLKKEGADMNNIAKEYGIDKTILNPGIAMYDYERKRTMKSFGLNENGGDSLFIGEILSRLKINAKPVIYSLVADGRLDEYSSTNGYNINFISLESFKKYLGIRRGKILYNSREAKAKIDPLGKPISIGKIDTISYKNQIGMKIQSNRKMSFYLFTENEINELKTLR